MPKSQTGRRVRPSFPSLLTAASAAMVALWLAGCASVEHPAPVACAAAPTTPAAASATCAPCPAPGASVAAPPPAKPMRQVRWSELPGWNEDDLTAAWPAFLNSCKGLASKPQWALWRPACDEAKTLGGNDAAALRRFFESRFQPYLLTNPDGTTEGLITGYYEPLLRGSRTRSSTFSQPILGVPPDLLTIDLSDVLPDLKNMRLRGRLQGNKVVPYYSRAEIVGRQTEKGDNASRVLYWVDDAIELFFLQVQGSGRVKLPDGRMVRVGYADQNGYPYQSIGRVLIERGDLKAEQASMQGIQAWARANPDKLNDLLNSNPSYVFFRELPSTGRPDDGPPGALGVPLARERSVAVDPVNVPLGAPVFLSTTQPNSSAPLRRLVLAQDTGGAIRGVVRADFFWGFGPDAGAAAGRMKQSGQMWALLPPGVAPK